MSELTTIALVCALSVPSTALIVSLVCRSMLARVLHHMEVTQIVGGTPKEIFVRKNEQGLQERKQRLDSRKPKSLKNVIS